MGDILDHYRWLWRGIPRFRTIYHYWYCYILDLALNGTASQSSEYGRDLIPASNGIDGDTKWPNCSHTAKEMNSHLQIDLSKNAEIFEITIFNRVDQEVTKRRLKRFSISIGKTDTIWNMCNKWKHGQWYI